MSFSHKSKVLNQGKLQPFVKKLQESINSALLAGRRPSAAAPGLARAAAFDLTYLLLRHRSWYQAPLLAELAVDFLTSEYWIAGERSQAIVDAALAVMRQSLGEDSQPMMDIAANAIEPESMLLEAIGRSAIDNAEFIEHLIVGSLISLDESSLEIDLGFGRNLMTLLKSALALEVDGPILQFAPELTLEINTIMRRIFDEIEESPANMDLYRLKNVLQRDELSDKNILKKNYLVALSQVLAACWSEGKTARQLEAVTPLEDFPQHLDLLLRNGLVYQEPPPRRGQQPTFRLSNKGCEITAIHFAFARWQDLGTTLHLAELPSPYQATLLQILAKESDQSLQALIQKEGRFLSPIALRFVIEHLKNIEGEKGILEIFNNLLHNQAHAWIRVEICQALPLPSGASIGDRTLENLLNDDPSPMVRSAARAASNRQRSMARLTEVDDTGAERS